MELGGARTWRFEELELIESFVNRAAVALMNANLHKQLEWAAALEERQRIAADMHDGLAQTVSILGLRVDEVLALMAGDSDRVALEELSEIRDTVERVSVDVRRSIASLHEPPPPRQTLYEMLSDLLGQLPVGDGPAIGLICDMHDSLILPPEQGAQALPIVQEALLNAQRHAGAQRITLQGERRGQEAIITVEDDGRGFEPSTWWQNSHDHFGLSVMHARAARVGGSLQIDSAPGQGARVILRLPLAGGELARSFAGLQQAAGQNIAIQGLDS
jgi:signal transduction histidine kinase